MRSLKQKLLFLILPLCLIPLVGISIFSYQIAEQRITEDRIVLYVEQIAKDIADTIRLSLLEKKEETIAMGLSGEFREFLLHPDRRPPQALLNQFVIVHEVYDVLVLFDADGKILLTSSINRNRLTEELDARELLLLRGQNLKKFTPDSTWLQQVRAGHFGYIDWHVSPLVHRLYNYDNDDIMRQYSIGFAAPILDDKGVPIGGILGLMNWEYIQEILDKVEDDLEARSLTTGYAFLFGNDQDTIIGHKYRRNRSYPGRELKDPGVSLDNYGTRLLEDHHLVRLHQAVVDGKSSCHYEYPPGTAKISGLAPVQHEFFHWVCGVGINDEEIFAPVRQMKRILIWAASLWALGMLAVTFFAARRITTPLKRLTRGARVIAAGDFSQRVKVKSRDEIGELALSFNEMASSLEERSQALIELNKSLEEKVQKRTRELEQTNREVQKAYQELKETQVQLVQSEKMASLGQLVAGVAHEIKNPLNFIYGNTDFLKQYVGQMKQLIELYEQSVTLDEQERSRIEEWKQQTNYEFVLEDLGTLIRNFEEGAERIASIVSDLKSFSRMDKEEFSPADLREIIELALGILHNEYRDRITIHREFADLGAINCHAGRLSQVFMNLLSNSCQAIQGKGDIWVRTFSRDGFAVVEIEDNGPGIESDHVNHIFEPFFSTKPVGKGTGLGLSISYAIVRQHGGTIEVEGRPGRGALFRVQIPIES